MRQLNVDKRVSEKLSLELKEETNLTFDSEAYFCLVDKVDNIFKQALNSTYCEFSVLGDPIVASSQVDELILDYKTTLRPHYLMMKKLLGINKKEKYTKNDHLIKSGYYDRLIFFNFLTLVRVKNPQHCIHWAMICAAALYYKGVGDCVTRRSTYCGSSATIKTFLKNVKPMGNEMLQNITEILKQEKTTIATLDNNQKGYKKTYQRYGMSTEYVKVTGRYFRQYVPDNDDDLDNIIQQVPITYVNQKIPSIRGMHQFEVVDTSIHENIADALLLKIANDDVRDTEGIDFSGRRVDSYSNLIDLADAITNGIKRYGTGYILTKKTMKEFEFTP